MILQVRTDTLFFSIANMPLIHAQFFKNVQAHDQAIRSMVWSHNDNWMVSGDDGGAIK